jgi:hypothetical protein
LDSLIVCGDTYVYPLVFHIALFLKAHYPKQLWCPKIQLKVDELNRKETLKYRKKHKNKKMDRVPLILTYSRALPDIGKILSSLQSFGGP